MSQEAPFCIQVANNIVRQYGQDSVLSVSMRLDLLADRHLYERYAPGYLRGLIIVLREAAAGATPEELLALSQDAPRVLRQLEMVIPGCACRGCLASVDLKTIFDIYGQVQQRSEAARP